MRLIKILFISICSNLLFSCSSSFMVSNSTSKTTDVVSTGVTQMPVVADLDVSNDKIEAEVKSKQYDESVEKLKRRAITKALETGNWDVLIEPKFKIWNIDGQKTVKVNGYPAVYKNFRNASSDDREILNTVVSDENDLEVNEAEEVYEPSSSGKNVLLAIGSSALVIGILVFLG